jgi:hypothetical protein
VDNYNKINIVFEDPSIEKMLFEGNYSFERILQLRELFQYDCLVKVVVFNNIAEMENYLGRKVPEYVPC